MKVDFRQGFIAYDFGDNPDFVFVNVHPTTHLEFIPRNDIGADLLSVQLARQMACKAVITTMPRSHEFGMDMNRLPPSEALAGRMFDSFANNDFGKTEDYEKRYAWVASDSTDHKNRKTIYESFWSLVREICSKHTVYVIIHVQDPELRNFPSIMDIVPIYGFEEAGIKKVVNTLNHKYARLFDSLKEDFVDFMLSYHKHQHHAELLQRFNSLNPDDFSGSLRKNHEKMLNRILQLGFEKDHNELKNSYSFEKHARTIKNTGLRIPPEITYMTNFTGELALGTKKELKGQKVMEIEMSTFLSEVHTDIGIDILKEFLKNLN